MKPLNFLALIAFVSGFVWVITRSEPAVREIQRIYYSAMAPFLKGGTKIEQFARNFVQEVEHSKTLEKKLALIEDDYGRLKNIESRFRDLERENAQLKSALNFKKRSRFDVIAAEVIKRQPSTWWKTAIINRGEQAGIGVQMPVLAQGGLVGKIERSYPDNLATVLLISDESCQVSARVDRTPEVGILSGERGQYGRDPRLRLRFLSKDAQIRPGMKVFTTGRGGVFPANVLVGEIESFSSGTYEGEARVIPSVDLKDLTVVFVLTEGTGPETESGTQPKDP